MEKVSTYIKRIIEDSIQTKKTLLTQSMLQQIENVSNKVIESLNSGGKVIFAGNGGSAADSQHLAAEFVSRFEFDRPGLPSISLTTDTSMITAISNDYGYEKLFTRQLEANSKNNDIFIGISTSGKSKNLINAFNYCVSKNIFCVSFTGEDGMTDCNPDIEVCVASKNTARIQECHITIGHILCGITEKHFFGHTI